jgi:KaiC/GvpD/RAD55 family RecA-like ATPase
MKPLHSRDPEPVRNQGDASPPPMTTEERRALAEAARRWHDAGCCVHPAKADGSKAPVNVKGGSPDVDEDGNHGWGWGRIAHGKIPPLTVNEITSQIMSGRVDGVGVFAGPASGELEMIEVEGRAVERLDEIGSAASRLGVADLLQRLSHGCVERSAGRGLHFLLRVSDGPALGNTALARRPDPDAANGYQVTAETRGVGGWFVAAPSAGRTHKSGRPYEFVRNGPETIPTFTAEERDQLHLVFRSIDEMPVVEPVEWQAKQIETVEQTAGRGLSPGDDFAQRTSWEEILRPAGWKLIGTSGSNLIWQRPGKNSGPSATTNTAEGDLMYVHSTSTPLPAGKGLGKFAVFTHLHHGGDFSAAARDLRKKGYGEGGCEEVVEASDAPDDADDVDLSGLSFVPAGRPDGMLARVSVSRDGKLVDLAEIDLGNLEKRENYAGRVAGILGDRVKVSAVKEWLLEAAATRSGQLKAGEGAAGRIVSLSKMLQEWRTKTASPVVETGFQPLDALGNGGLPVGGLTVLAGAPGVGKSALAMQAAIGALVANPSLRVLWAAGEMTQDKIAQRAVVQWAAGPGNRKVSMDTAGARTAAALQMADQLEQSIGDRLAILPAPLPLDQIVEATVATKAGLVVLDYIQLVTVAGSSDRRGEVDAVVRAVRTLATEHEVAVLVLSNIARSVGADSRAGQIGKESSEIDFAADILLLGVEQEGEQERLHAVDVAGIDWSAKAVLWRCTKNRHGEQRDMRTAFTGKRQLFIPIANPAEEFDEFKAHAPCGSGR